MPPPGAPGAAGDQNDPAQQSRHRGILTRSRPRKPDSATSAQMSCYVAIPPPNNMQPLGFPDTSVLMYQELAWVNKPDASLALSRPSGGARLIGDCGACMLYPTSNSGRICVRSPGSAS